MCCALRPLRPLAERKGISCQSQQQDNEDISFVYKDASNRVPEEHSGVPAFQKSIGARAAPSPSIEHRSNFQSAPDC
jgi:hypothetical protein